MCPSGKLWRAVIDSPIYSVDAGGQRYRHWQALDHLEAASKVFQQGESFRKEAAMAKLVATEAGGRVVDRCMQMFGGLGVAKDLPFERWYREMRIRRIGEGPSEVQRHDRP